MLLNTHNIQEFCYFTKVYTKAWAAFPSIHTCRSSSKEGMQLFHMQALALETRKKITHDTEQHFSQHNFTEVFTQISERKT